MTKILWIDDEADLLKPYFLYLEEKGYDVDSALSGRDGLEMCDSTSYDIIFLDENMPGLSGLETLELIKESHSSVPVVMITKNEEEDIMNQAIGAKITDYLLKPVNPKQIILTLKKHIHQHDIISDRTTVSYRQDFAKIGMEINTCRTAEDWKVLYKRLIRWEIELENANAELKEMLNMQKQEANKEYAKFVARNYESWFKEGAERPLMSPDVMKKVVFPLLDKGEKVFMIVVDNFRYDQWLAIKGEVCENYNVDSDDPYIGILPTATQYARNAIFSGLMPNMIEKLYPQLWVEEGEDEGKNLNEDKLIGELLKRYRRQNSYCYFKVNNSASGAELAGRLDELKKNDLNVCVLNFIDMLSHAKADSRMMRELVNDESAYRSLTLSWFQHSATKTLFKVLAQKGYKVVVTTDHGTIRVRNAVKVVGDKETSVNLRYKVGKNLGYNKKDVVEFSNPKNAGLTSPNISSTYIFAKGDDFMAYPNNYNYYVGYYKNTFQHGGVSMEEMIIPLVVLTAK